jgi:hypothetical protein
MDVENETDFPRVNRQREICVERQESLEMRPAIKCQEDK